jgi:acetyl esterase/lipase
MNYKAFVSILLLSCLFGQVRGQYCTTDTRYTEVAYFDSTEITIGNNIQYGIALDHLGNPDTLLMDLYYPKLAVDPSPLRPFVMLFHGGGFVSGDKQSGDIQDLCAHLALRGFVCASVNYRLGFDFSEYGQYKARYRAIQDGNAAMRYIVNNANAVRIDTNWLFVGGQSAGSLLALGMVYADPSELDSISLLYSATSTSMELGNLYTSGNSLTNTYALKGIFNNWGAVVETEVDVAEMLPTVAFHGELDTTVLIGTDGTFAHYSLMGSRSIHDALTAEGTCSELTVDLTGEHGIFRNASSVFRAQRASCFFKSVFCSTCADFYSTDSIPSTCSSPAAADDQDLGPNIVVFPNPSDGSFAIEGIGGMFELTIVNWTGQTVYTDDHCTGAVQADLMPGTYFLKIRTKATNKLLTARVTAL